MYTVIAGEMCNNVTANATCGANTVCVYIEGIPTCFCDRTGFYLVENKTCEGEFTHNRDLILEKGTYLTFAYGS